MTILEKKPDFFIVGAGKSGTTALYSYLSQHPSIFMPSVKEPHFFGSDTSYPRYTRNLKEYLDLFNDGKDLLCGEGSTSYLVSEKAAQEIYNFNPDAKIIIMIRNPIDAMYSMHNQSLFMGNETIENFEHALAAQEERKQGLNIPETCRNPPLLQYTEVVRFSSMIQRYFDVFPNDQIHIIVYDEFKQNTDKVYQDTLLFLGIGSLFIPDFKIINSSKYVRFKSLQLFLRKLHRNIGLRLFIRRILPSKMLLTLISLVVNRINTRYQQRPPMEPLLRKQLQKQFAPEIEQLGVLLGKDLSHWYQK